MNRFIFSLYDKEAEKFSDPMIINHDDEEKACKIAMRNIARSKLDTGLIPVEDLKLYLLGSIDPMGYLVGDEPVLIINVDELYKGETDG